MDRTYQRQVPSGHIASMEGIGRQFLAGQSFKKICLATTVKSTGGMGENFDFLLAKTGRLQVRGGDDSQHPSTIAHPS